MPLANVYMNIYHEPMISLYDDTIELGGSTMEPLDIKYTEMWMYTVENMDGDKFLYACTCWAAVVSLANKYHCVRSITLTDDIIRIRR